MDSMLFAGFALAYLALFAWGVVAASRHGWATPANLPLLVIAALVYDNGVLALGAVIGHGPLLAQLSLVRFALHALFTPLLVAWALHALARAGFAWARSQAYAAAAVVVTVALVALEWATGVRGLFLEPRDEFGAVSYTDAAPASGPPVMVLLVVLVLLVAGLLLWRRQGWPWLVAGALVMTIGSAVELPLPSRAVTNAFELVLLVSVIATKVFQDRRAAASDAPTSVA